MRHTCGACDRRGGLKAEREITITEIATSLIATIYRVTDARDHRVCAGMSQACRREPIDIPLRMRCRSY